MNVAAHSRITQFNRGLISVVGTNMMGRVTRKVSLRKCDVKFSYYSPLFYLLCGENDLQGGRRGQVGAKHGSKAQVEAFHLPFWIRLYHKSIAFLSLYLSLY